MIHLIWSVLNTLLLIIFTILLFGFIFQGTKILRGKFKHISAFILIGGIIGITYATSSEPKSNNIKVAKFNVPYNQVRSKTFVLEDNLTHDITIHTQYFKSNNTIELIEGASSLGGFVSGLDWQMKHFTSTERKDGKTELQVYGVLKWHLLGINFYTQSKHFKQVIQ